MNLTSSQVVERLSIPTPKGHQWIDTRTAEKVWQRSRATILNWCRDGTFQYFGMSVRQDHTGKWYILVRVPSQPRSSQP
jgi:hypothetical protein